MTSDHSLVICCGGGVRWRGERGLHAIYKTKIREVGARLKMWLDVNFLDTAPTHLGEKVELPGEPQSPAP